MNMKQLYPFILFLSLFLAACGGTTSTNTSTPVSTGDSEAVVEVPAADTDELKLPPLVDVQTVATIRERDDVFVLDVREQWEYDEGHLSGITHIPIDEVPNRLSEIPSDKNLIIYCASGVRSGRVTDLLLGNGYTNVHNMQGGIVAWQRAGLPVEK